MATRLCIDLGNTAIKLAVFKDDFQVYYLRMETVDYPKLDRVVEEFDVKSSIYSSTRHVEPQFIDFLEKKTQYLPFDHNTPIPIRNHYKSPETLGRDRLAGVIGARSLFPDQHAVVIDAGTCITMDFINRLGEYKGGIISPGLRMRAEAMHTHTDKLPLVDLSLPDYFLGSDTTSSLQNGVIRGTIYEIESFIRTVEADFGPVKVILTGGDARHFEEHVKFPIFASSNLVLVGLNEIIKFNDQ